MIHDLIGVLAFVLLSALFLAIRPRGGSCSSDGDCATCHGSCELDPEK